MAVEPSRRSDLSPPTMPLAMRVIGGVTVAIVALLVLRWIFGILWTLVRLGIFVAILVGIIYAVQQFRSKD
ncbi:MAG: hypothetical protein HKN03_18415 [Acidimicrobiales bacterium]|nr:hypothetical protein [Acidimicrobiales bacterium]